MLTLWSAVTAMVVVAEVQKAPEVNHWMAVVIAIVLILGIAVISCASPRRGHRD